MKSQKNRAGQKDVDMWQLALNLKSVIWLGTNSQEWVYHFKKLLLLSIPQLAGLINLQKESPNNATRSQSTQAKFRHPKFKVNTVLQYTNIQQGTW